MKGSFLNLEYSLAFFDLNHGIALAMRTKAGRATVLRTPLWAGPIINALYRRFYAPSATVYAPAPPFYAKYREMQRSQYPEK